MTGTETVKEFLIIIVAKKRTKEYFKTITVKANSSRETEIYSAVWWERER